MQTIPYIDLRSEGASLLTDHAERGRILLKASTHSFGLLSRIVGFVFLPVGDVLSHRWLRATKNPYLPELEEAARVLKVRGVYALNCIYEWGCTSGVYATENAPMLARVLDWPFPELGAQLVVAHQRGAAGEFFNATWPAVSGVFQAVAPGRFAASLNQAPMRRHPTGILLDWLRNRVRQQRSRALPPAHLLRKVFEEARTYEEARAMLCDTPICLPVIFTLSGIEPGQGCVIERLEESAFVREMHTGAVGSHVSAANHFTSHLNGAGWGWLPRADTSYGRACAAETTRPKDLRDLSWFVAPIANKLSRLVMQADAATGRFTLMGTHGIEPVTEVFHGGESL